MRSLCTSLFFSLVLAKRATSIRQRGEHMKPLVFVNFTHNMLHYILLYAFFLYQLVMMIVCIYNIHMYTLLGYLPSFIYMCRPCRYIAHLQCFIEMHNLSTATVCNIHFICIIHVYRNKIKYKYFHNDTFFLALKFTNPT